jgi:hypothetical protein
VARDAISRLYDVQASSVVYTKPPKRGKYDHGTVTFKARKGKRIDLDKLHESVWATRLSGGTSSGLVRLDVTAASRIERADRVSKSARCNGLWRDSQRDWSDSGLAWAVASNVEQSSAESAHDSRHRIRKGRGVTSMSSLKEKNKAVSSVAAIFGLAAAVPN